MIVYFLTKRGNIMKSLGEYKIRSKVYNRIVETLYEYPTVKSDEFITKQSSSCLSGELNSFLQLFLKKTNNMFSFENLDKKLSELEIKKLSSFHRAFLGIGGYYDIDKHQIKVTHPIEENIYHELFHAFTSFRISDDVYGSGFFFYNKGKSIGYMFDEGYTDYLTTKYFDNAVFYRKEANIAQKVELIVGKGEMEKMYSSNNLVRLTSFLSSFSSFDDTVKFLMLMDKFSIRGCVTYEELGIINDVSNYLVDIYINYLTTMYKNGFIEMPELIDRLEEFKMHFSDYIFENEFDTYSYEKSSDYVDITHKLTKKYAQKVFDRSTSVFV